MPMTPLCYLLCHLRVFEFLLLGTVLKESDDLDTLEVTFDSKMTFESIFAPFPEQLLKGFVS